MNIGVEYLARTRLVEDLITYPCSFFLANKNNGNKIIICINKDQNYLVKQWNLYQCNASQALPPMEGWETSEITDTKIILPGMEILSYKHMSIPARENTTRKPMDKYNGYFDDYLERFDLHNKYKERWLWNSFLSIYSPELVALGMEIKRNVNMYGVYAIHEIMENQKQIIEFRYPKIWKYWNLWRKHMLDFDGVPGEFVFAGHYSGMLKISGRLGMGT